MSLNMPVVSLHSVSPAGAISLIAANIPYSNLQWTRRMSGVGEFAIELACPMPAEWPGRYLLTASGHDEVGVVEKCEASEGDGGATASLSGRFAECLWDRYKLKAPASARGANWRQAVTAALSSWHMGDLPPLAMGDGTEAATGSSYAISGAAGDSAMELIYQCASANGARPVIGYDRDADPAHLSVRIVDGADRTTGQSARPFFIMSLEMGTASGIDYSGDYSVACSEVAAHAEKDADGDTLSVDRTVQVPGFDAATMWEARAYEDVSSLMDDDEAPSASAVDQAANLRTYDHMPEIGMDGSVSQAGYREEWDVGDLIEGRMPSLGLIATERVEEAREVHKKEGSTVEATVGTKAISRIRRALMGRR